MKLFVVRHGETDENIDKVMQGNMDTVLNQTGIDQATKVRDSLINTKIDLIITSPMKRAFKTASIISNGKIPIMEDKRLLSRNHGEFEGLRRGDIDLQGYWNFKEDRKYEKAESVGDMFKRVDSLLQEIRLKYSDKVVLLVTHSGICRILHYYFNGIPSDGNLLGYESYNCSVEEYELEDRK